jgi:hypothetical protein
MPDRMTQVTGVGENGQFSLVVPPGTYRLFAWEDLDTGQHYDPGFLKTYERQSITITVQESSRAQILLKEIPAGPEFHR